MNKWFGVMTVVVVSVVLGAVPVSAANFDGSTDTSWADGSNWNTEPEYPGGATATEHHGFIYGGLTCDLATALSQNLTVVQVSQATLNINSGGSANSVSGLGLGEVNASGDSILKINSGGSWTNSSQLNFARHGNSTDKTGVSELHVNGGFYSQGHNIVLRDSGTGTTARLRVSGGTVSIGGGRNWGEAAGTGTQTKEVVISGGSVDFSGAAIYVAAQVSALLRISGGNLTIGTLETNTNGPNNHIEVSGTNASITAATMNVFGGTVGFTAKAAGVSAFQVTTLNLEGATAADRGALEVDVTARPCQGRDGLELFAYSTLASSPFGSVVVLDDDLGKLTEGVQGSLVLGEYAIDYNTDNKITLYYHNQPPLGTVYIVR